MKSGPVSAFMKVFKLRRVMLKKDLELEIYPNHKNGMFQRYGLRHLSYQDRVRKERIKEVFLILFVCNLQI